MKKIASGVFSALIMLNVLGFYPLFLLIRHHHSDQFSKNLALHPYDESETVTIKIPLKISFAVDSKSIVSENGEVEHRGEVYRLLRHKLYQDTFRIVCLKDRVATRINKALRDYVKTFADDAGGKDRPAHLLSLFIKEFFAPGFSVSRQASGWKQDLDAGVSLSVFAQDFHISISQPPEFV